MSEVSMTPTDNLDGPACSLDNIHIEPAPRCSMLLQPTTNFLVLVVERLSRRKRKVAFVRNTSPPRHHK